MIFKLLRRAIPAQAVYRFLAMLPLALFACSHSEAADDSDAEESLSHYAVVGLARFDGISYASLIDRQTQEHFLLSTDNPDEEPKLISIVPDDDPVRPPSATVQWDGVSLVFPLEAGALATSSVLPAPHILMPGAKPSVFQPKPPPGGTLPIVFKAVDSGKLHLNEQQRKFISQLRRDFLGAIGAGGVAAAGDSSTAAADNSSRTDTSVPANQTTSMGDTSLNTWQSAQEQSDDIFRMTFGWQAFSDYQMALLHQAH